MSARDDDRKKRPLMFVQPLSETPDDEELDRIADAILDQLFAPEEPRDEGGSDER